MSGDGNRQGGWKILYNYRMKNKPLKVNRCKKTILYFCKNPTLYISNLVEKSVIDSKQALRFIFIKLKASGKT